MDIIDPFQGFNTGLANLVQSSRQAQLDGQQKRLADLQFKGLQEEADYKSGLKSAMSAPQPGIPAEQPFSMDFMAAQRPSPLKLSDVKPPKSSARAGADYALSQGRIEDAVKLFTVDDQLAQLQAKGDLSGYYEAKQELDMNKQFFETVKKSATIPGGLKQMWPQLQRMFPDQTAGITPDSIQTNGRLVLAPLEMDGQVIPNRGVYYDEDGKQHIVDTTPKSDPEAMIDKRFANQQKLTQMQIDASDRRAAADRAAADRRANAAALAKDRAPGKILPAGQLESIADMKRVKDVLAEAANDMATNKVSTGPVAGRLQALGAKIGAADDAFVNVQQKLQTAQNIMLKLRSGAAVTESEFTRFLKEYPTPNDPPEVFKRKMRNTINYASTLMDGKLDIYEEGGYKVPKSAKSGGRPAPAKGNAPIVTKGGFKVTRVP